MIAIEIPADVFLPAIEPHPELVAAMRPTPAQVAEATVILGLLSDPDERWIRPAVSA